MKRKLVKQGESTMMISLPSKWIKENKLDKGDEIDLEESENKLVISSEANNKKNSTKIKLSSQIESSIRTLITTTYRRGYDKIEVEFENEKQFKILQEVIKTRLIGFDIIKKDSRSCIVENVTEPSAEQFGPILNKFFLNIIDLFNLTKNSLEGKKSEEDFEEVEERIQKYDNFCRRILYKQRNSKIELFWTFLTLIVHGQREIYLLNKNLGKETSKSVIDLLEESKKIFEIIIKSYETKDISHLSKIHDLEKDLIYKKGYSLLEKSKGKETIAIYHILASIRNFYQANSPLLGFIS